MNDGLQTTLLIATVIAGLSGWAAVFAWWFRERSKTVRGIKELRRTNTRLQKTVMFTLDKWRDQVDRNLFFLEVERKCIDRLAEGGPLSAATIRSSIRSEVCNGGDGSHHHQNPPANESALSHDLAAIEEVARMTKTGSGPTIEYDIESSMRSAA